MTTTLITGANKGLGREAARRLLAEGHDVWLGARDPDRGRTAADDLGTRFVALDVTDDHSVAGAAATIEADGGLDVLVNNAGIPGGFLPVPDTSADDVRAVLETNVLGPVRVLHAFLPLLERSAAPVVVNVSSGMGSFAVTTDPERLESGLVAIAYPASKAAVNMLTSQYAKAYPQMRITRSIPATPPPTSTATGAPRPSSRAPRSSCVWRWSGRTAPAARSWTSAGTSRGDRLVAQRHVRT